MNISDCNILRNSIVSSMLLLFKIVLSAMMSLTSLLALVEAYHAKLAFKLIKESQ